MLLPVKAWHKRQVIEPTLIFAGCKLAYEGIKTAVAAYKDIKATGKEVSGIAHEVGGFLSTFFLGQQQLEDTYEKSQKEAVEAAKQGKAKNATMQAIDNVLQIRQIRQYYKDLEHMVRYELGMPDLWVEIQQERDKIVEEQKEIARLQKIADDQAEARRRYRMHLFRQKLHIYVALILGIITIVLSIAGLMWLVSWDKEWRWGY